MTVAQSQAPLISSAPPSGVQKRAAFVTAMLLLVVFFSVLPFAHVRLERLDVFLPIFATILFLTDSISAALLYAHFAILRSWSLRLLAGGYLFCALIIIPYALTFPGAFAPNGLFQAGLQTSPWLFTVWQMALPTAIIMYSTARNVPPQRMVRSSVATAVAVDACIVAALVCAVTWFLTTHEDMMPPLIVTVTDTAAFVKFVSPFMLMVSMAALVSIWFSQRSVLDLWLVIVALAWLLSSILLNLVDVRFDVAWYANRILAVASGSLVLLVLLAESTMLYARVAMSAEGALRESEDRYERAMEASDDGFWDWIPAADTVYASPRLLEIYGFAPGTTFNGRDDLVARIPFHPEDRLQMARAIAAHFAGKTGRLDIQMRFTRDGQTRWVHLVAVAVRDSSGAMVRWTGTVRDVTERKRAEEELRAMELRLRQAQRLEAMGTFAGGIAHDFNNILGAILGFGEMARRGAPKGSRLAGDLESILTAGERGRALVGRLLAFSRSVVGERVQVHVERVVREALDVVSAKLPPRVTVHAQLHAGNAAILGDETQVHQVVTNLATNAVHAMPAGGRLRVELASVRVETPRAATVGGLAVGEYVVLTVADTGTGIPPEILERIFDPFFTTKEVGTGTGLGLSLVHGIVTELGGCIDLVTQVGAGTTFTVYLPRSGEAAEAEHDAEAALPRGEGQRVLVVDDEEPLVRHATRALEELGYAPVGYTSSSDALAALRADPQRFDALITDERMPGVSGSALIREVRGIRSSLPVVLMSGYLGPTADKVRESGQLHTLGLTQKIAAAIGADEVLQKPLSARDLATSLARVLRH